LIALFVSLFNSVSTVSSTSGRASSTWSVTRTIITVLIVISDSITTGRGGTVESALRWVGSDGSNSGSVIALFTIVNNTITTEGETTVCTASIWRSVAVGGSVVALFALRIQDTVTTLGFTDRAASVEVEVVSIITILTRVSDSITTSRETASQTASTRGGIAVTSSIVAKFVGIDDSVSAKWLNTVVTAARRRASTIAVESILITRFVDSPKARSITEVLSSSVSARAV